MMNDEPNEVEVKTQRLNDLWKALAEKIRAFRCMVSVWVKSDDGTFSLGWSRYKGKWTVCYESTEPGAPVPRTPILSATLRIRTEAATLAKPLVREARINGPKILSAKLDAAIATLEQHLQDSNSEE